MSERLAGLMSLLVHRRCRGAAATVHDLLDGGAALPAAVVDLLLDPQLVLPAGAGRLRVGNG